MKHFRVLQYGNVDSLAEAVEQAINDGWKIAGDMFFSKHNESFHYNQPIIKTSRSGVVWKEPGES
jgi:hypothetical protein